jgi:hypothetical protein
VNSTTDANFPITNISYFTEAGYWSYLAVYSETQNYSNAAILDYLTISAPVPTPSPTPTPTVTPTWGGLYDMLTGDLIIVMVVALIALNFFFFMLKDDEK